MYRPVASKARVGQTTSREASDARTCRGQGSEDWLLSPVSCRGQSPDDTVGEQPQARYPSTIDLSASLISQILNLPTDHAAELGFRLALHQLGVVHSEPVPPGGTGPRLSNRRRCRDGHASPVN